MRPTDPPSADPKDDIHAYRSPAGRHGIDAPAVPAAALTRRTHPSRRWRGRLTRFGALLAALVALPLLAAPGSGFQHYFATSRACLASAAPATCLPFLVGTRVHRPGDDLSRDAFLARLAAEPGLRAALAACFAPGATIVHAARERVLFRGARYACEAVRVAGRWRLEAFYDFLAAE